jgi:hypothetical protein
MWTELPDTESLTGSENGYLAYYAYFSTTDKYCSLYDLDNIFYLSNYACEFIISLHYLGFM